jgi:hypothetical protein
VIGVPSCDLNFCCLCSSRLVEAFFDFFLIFLVLRFWWENARFNFESCLAWLKRDRFFIDRGIGDFQKINIFLQDIFFEKFRNLI